MGAISTAAPDLWLKADAITGLTDGQAVSSWTDSSGNGLHATQGTSGRQPLYKTNVVGSLPGVLFDGSNDALQSTMSASGAAQTIVAVVRPAGAGTIRTISGGAFQFRIEASDTTGLVSQGVALLGVSRSTVSAGAAHVVTATYTAAGSVSTRIDGSNDFYATVGATVASGLPTNIGARGDGAEPFNGHILEYLRWGRVLTATEMVAVEAELAAKWGSIALTVYPAITGVTVTASGNFGGWDPWHVCDGVNTSGAGNAWTHGAVAPAWLRQQLSVAAAVTSYSIAGYSSTQSPKDWTLEGSNDGTTWTTLDTQSGFTTWTAAQVRTFTISNTTAYTYYRLNVTAVCGASSDWPTINEWPLFTSASATAVSAGVGNPAGVGASPVTVAGVGNAAGSASGPHVAAGVGNTAGVAATPMPASGVGNPAGWDSGTGPDTEVAGVGNPAGIGSVPHGDSGQGNAAGISAAPHVVAGIGNLAGWASGEPFDSSMVIPVGVTIEVGALTLLNIVALPAVEIAVGLAVETGDSMPVVPLPGISVEVGVSLIARASDVPIPDPRRNRPQWRYVITDLTNAPVGELTDLEHDPVEDGIGEATTMQFSMSTDSAEHALIKPIERQCQVWDGDRLLLRGPILPGQPSDDGTSITYKIHDPSWFWRDGRRVITHTPQLNLLHNGDFKSGLSWWTRGYDADSKPAAAPNVRVVAEDFADDTDGLDPIKAAEITGVESYAESELSSNAVFWPNLATFRPGGVASIEAVADDMPTTAGLKVTVIGHTANDGTGNGLGLSLRRANAAAAIIQAKRPGAVITTRGVGFYDPKPGFPIDSQEQRRVVIQYDETITGESKQWMRQTIEVTQPKAARYNLTLTAAAMLKVADDWSVPDANMVSVKVAARRKSAPTKPWDDTLGVGSASISDTDPIDRWIPQTAEATIPADGRPYLVDVYLYAPAALARYTAVGLFPDEQLYFWGVDQASIFRGVMEHIQKPEFGYADLGVFTRTPTTGIKRDREWAFRDLTPADTALDGLMGISRGIEWDTVTTPTRTTATTFYPRQGKTVDYVLALGGNVTAAVPANTRDVGSAIIAQAQGLGTYRAVAYASDKRAFGGTLIQRVVTAEQDTPLNELRETAKAELFWARSSTPAYWVDIDPDSIEEVLAETSKGDTVRLILDYPVAVDRLARIVRRQIHPDGLRLMVAFEEA